MQKRRLSVKNLKIVGFFIILSTINAVSVRLSYSQIPDNTEDKLISVIEFYGGERREYEHSTVYVFSKRTPRDSWDVAYDSLTALGPFPGLSKMDFPGGSIYYKADISEEINKLYRNLDPRDPLFDSTSAMADDPVLIRSPLVGGSDEKFIIAFSWGPSDDFSFDIYRDDKKRTRVGGMNGNKMYVPGNGYLYEEGHTNNSFNHRKKYRFTGQWFVESHQAHYYVGLKTTITARMEIFSDTTYTEVVATLAENQPVEVLIADFNEDSQDGHDYLLKTPFGLTGWTRITYSYPRTHINGIYYRGD